MSNLFFISLGAFFLLWLCFFCSRVTPETDSTDKFNEIILHSVICSVLSAMALLIVIGG